jgi:hypothetical protein
MPNEFIVKNGLISQDNITVTGSIIATGGITISGSIASASYASNAELLDGLDSTAFTLTSSFNIQTASFTAFTSSINSFSASVNTFSASILTYTSSLNAKTSSFATTGSNTFIGTETISGSLVISGSGTPFTLNTDTLEITGSLIVSGSTTLTGSLLQSGNFTTTGTLTAQTLVVQTITSSVDFVTGSTRFGSLLANTHVFTGSMSVSGGASFNTAQNFTVRSTSTGWISSFTNDYNNTSYIGIDNEGIYIQPSSKGTKLVAGDGITYLYVTSSGVGIGTSSPSELLHLYKSSTVYQMIQTVSGGSGTVYRRSNSTTPDWTIGHGAASANENFEVYTAGTGAFTWTMNGSERMRITSAGTVGVGLTSGTGKLFAKQTTANFYDGINCYASANDSFTGIGHTGALGVVFSSYNVTAGAYTPLAFYTSDLERMRIDSTGRVTVNSPTTYVFTITNTTNTSGQGVFVTAMGSNNNNASSYHYIAATGGADKFYLFGNGTYQTVSDIRLKKNITTVTDTYLDKVKDLRIVNYNWNEQEEGSPLEFGMIAQEVEELIPSIVHEGREHEDGFKYKGIQASVLPYILIKAIQELTARVQYLENK